MLKGVIDTHAHYHDAAFDGDRAVLIPSLFEEGIEAVVDVAAEKASLAAVLKLVKEQPAESAPHSGPGAAAERPRPVIFGTAGLHPDEVGDLDDETECMIRRMLLEPKIVAVGEIGLDYHWMVQPKDVQERAFRRQIAIAKEFGKPVVIHSREAAEDTMRIVREENAAENGGIMHCYSYAAEQAKDYARMGFYLGVGGVITYKNGRKLRESVLAVGIDRIVLETDCPYLSPEPNRGKRNDSRNLAYVVTALADLFGLPEEEVIRITAENARKVFHI